MTDDETKSLELHRLKQWVDTVHGYWAEYQESKKKVTEESLHMGIVGDNISMAMLEIKDQERRLVELGFTREQIESVAKPPDMPFNVTSILKRVDGGV